MHPETPFQRVLVYGVTGSGKTTLAKRIGEATGLPWHSVDDLTWEPGWIQVPDEEQRRRIEAICGGPQWVLDSAYGVWLDVPLAKVDLIIGLDYPRWLSLWRLVRRTARRAFNGQWVCNGNQETFKAVFTRDGILVWHFKSFKRKRQRIEKWATDPSGPPVIHIRRPRDLEKWIASLPKPRG